MAQTRPRILLTLLAAATFLPFLGTRDIVISHEARVAQTARQMAESGWPWNAKPATVPAVTLGLGGEIGATLLLLPDPAAPPLHVNPWLVPVLNDEIRLQKPPLPYWCSAVLFRLAGHWSEGWARLIPALLGAFSTLLIYDLARLLLGRRFALAAALVWVTSYFIPDEFRKAMADPYLAFFALLATWGWIRGTRAGVLTFYIAMALGLLSKGPPLFIHLGIPIVLYHILIRRRPPGTIATHLLGLLFLAAIALPWPLYVLRHVPHAMEIWRFESVGELSDNIDNARPFWFYLPNLLLISLPWTPVLLLAIVALLRRARPSPPRRLLPLAWYALTVIFFSFVHLKKNAYLLPAMPAQTLLIAQGIVYCAADLRRRRKLSRPRFDECLIIASMVIVIVLIGFFNFNRTPIENARSPRLACRFIQMALANDPHTTVMPGRLPAEATLYLPLDIAYNPKADTLLYLIDDPRNRFQGDVAAFAKRLPSLNIGAVDSVPIPLAGRNSRYKLFRLTLSPAPAKHFT